MARTLGPMTVETSDAESAKFNAPLVLVHGLWDEPRSWRPFMSFLSHRGWRCLAVGWPPETRASVSDRCEALRAALAALDDQPILLGHDLGGWLALRFAGQARAAIAMAPLVPPPISSALAEALENSGSWFQRLRGGDRGAGKGLADSYPIEGTSEPAALLSDLATGDAADGDGSGETPCLVLAASDDGLSRVQDVRALAEAHGSDFEIIPGQHPLHVKEGWENHVGRAHRWLIKSQGQDLLAFYEEAWADREES